MPSSGFVAPGWEGVRDAFDGVLANPKEGGQVCVYHKGRKVVDIYGGCMDRDNVQPVTPATLSQIYSATKGSGALMVSMLVEEGKISIDEPVAKYWPEFAAAGKGAMTVRTALSHRGGLYATEASKDEAEDFLRFKSVVAAQAPRPLADGHSNAYHTYTIGIIMGGLVHSVTGLTPDEFFQQRVAGPLSLDFHIGRPRVKHVAAAVTEKRTKPLVIDPKNPPPPEVMAALGSMLAPGSAFNISGIHHTGAPSFDATNSLMFESLDATPGHGVCENASYAGFTNARSLARMYAAMLWPVDGVRLLSDQTVALVSKPEVTGKDMVLPVAHTTGWGPTGFCGPHAFFSPDGSYWLGPKDDASTYASTFCSPGAGGALGLADPKLGVAAAFVPTYYDQSMMSMSTAVMCAAIGAAAAKASAQ